MILFWGFGILFWGLVILFWGFVILFWGFVILFWGFVILFKWHSAKLCKFQSRSQDSLLPRENAPTYPVSSKRVWGRRRREDAVIGFTKG